MRYSMLKKFGFLLLLCVASLLNAAASCNPYGIPTYMAGYIPFTIVNTSASIASSRIYITIVGTDPDNGDSCIVQISSGVGSLVDATIDINSLNYSYPISSLPKQNGQPVVYLPPITNATLYLSVDYGMGLFAVAGSPVVIQPPSQFDTVDANYYHLYDASTFFTIGTTLNFQSQYNLAFGLPVSAIVSINNGQSNQYAGITGLRSTVFGNFTTALAGITNANSQAEWAKLPLSFTSASGGGVTTLRLASTLSAMSFSESAFDTDYLIDSGDYGVDWADTVFNPAPNPLYLDVSALATAGKPYTTYQYMGVTGGNLVFSPNGYGTDVTIPYPFTTSQPFLNAAPTGGDSFNASGDATASPTICDYLSAGFVSGLFPVTTTASAPFGNNYMALANATGSLYQANSAFPSGTGPWYDLYGQVLHGVMTPRYFNYEADAVDTNLGFFSPIIVNNNSNTQPSVVIVLGGFGTTVVPNFTDSNTYNILLAFDSSQVSITYNGSPVADTTSFPTATMPFTLGITYLSGTYDGQTYTSQVWVNTANNYGIVFPQPAATINPTYNSGSGQWNIGIGGSP